MNAQFEQERSSVDTGKRDKKDKPACLLCLRDTAIYFYQQDEIIRRLPDWSLTQLLQNMKKDLEDQADYLKYLKVSQELVRPCLCKEKVYHQYCMTANVIRNNTIYCKKCDMAYYIFVKKEKFCNAKLIRMLFDYCLFMVLIILVAAFVLILDGYLKTM